MDTSKENEKNGILQVFGSYILWGVLPIFWKLLSELNSVYVLATRIVWSAVFCLFLIAATKKTEELKAVLSDKKLRKTLLCSGIAVAINWGVYIYAVNNGHILDASLAYYMNPLIVIALGFFLFQEKLVLRQWMAIAVAALGILIAVIAYGEFPLFAIIIGSSFAVYGAIKKNVKCSGLISTFVEALFLSPLALLFILWAEWGQAGAIGTLEGMQFLLIPMSGIVTSIPLLLFSMGVSKVSLSLTGILMYINPTMQLLIGVLLYHETFDFAKTIMFVCVWIGVVLFISAGRKKQAE
ncbi:MAG: EamA family transporter RarD [Anaerotignum sp.]|nr:EamA family transporter RarD [Anaerotignum sp.]